MSGLLVAFGDLSTTPWSRMVPELDVLGGDGSASWEDRIAQVAVCRAYRHEHGTVWEPPVVRHEGCTIVFDGRLETARPEDGDEGDSRRVIDAYLRWGQDCAAHLDGEFAFILWDARHRRLHGACDVLGRRSLAFYWNGRHFLACTRVVTLLRHPAVPRHLDRRYAVHALCDVWSPLAGATPFASVRRLGPGRCISVEGSTLHERPADRVLLGPPSHVRDSAPLYEEFWSLLERSTRDRIHGARRPCLLLSGGLDSACVASSMAAVVGVRDAFSIVGPEHLDERHAIAAVLKSYPARWHQVAPDCERMFATHLQGPVLDDPRPRGAATLPSRVRVWEAMTDNGCDVALDGEGGEELFESAMTIGDLGRHGGLRQAAVYLARCHSVRAVAMRWLLIPRVGDRVRRAWVHRHRRLTDPFPPWLTPSFRASFETKAMVELQAEALKATTFGNLFSANLESLPQVAFRSAVRLLAATARVAPESPLFDRRLVRLAAGVPARLVLSPVHTKPFLRHASAGRLPDEVRWRPKRERLYADTLSRILASSTAVRLGALARGGPLREWVDPVVLQGVLGSQQSVAIQDPRNRERAHAALCFAGWVARVERDYGTLD